MKKVTLKFPSAALLWQYKQSISTLAVEINFHDLTLLCECSEAEIESAIKHFRATIIATADKPLSD